MLMEGNREVNLSSQYVLNIPNELRSLISIEKWEYETLKHTPYIDGSRAVVV